MSYQYIIHDLPQDFDGIRLESNKYPGDFMLF